MDISENIGRNRRKIINYKKFRKLYVKVVWTCGKNAERSMSKNDTKLNSTRKKEGEADRH